MEAQVPIPFALTCFAAVAAGKMGGKPGTAQLPFPSLEGLSLPHCSDGAGSGVDDRLPAGGQLPRERQAHPAGGPRSR